MFDQLKKDRQSGFGPQERLRLSLYVAAMLALGGFIVVGATRGSDKPKEAAAPTADDPGMDEGPLLEAREVARLVDEAGVAPESYATSAIEYVRKIQRTGRLGAVTKRLIAAVDAAAEGDPRGKVFEVAGRVIETSREEYKPRADSTDSERLWSVVLEEPGGGHVVVLYHGRKSDPGEGRPSDARPPLVRGEPIAAGQNVLARGVYLQERTGTIGQTALRRKTPVLFGSKFRIVLPPGDRLSPIASLGDALWSDVQDRFNRESRNWEEDATFEVIQWARAQGYEKVREAVLHGDIGWKDWGRNVFETWKKEVAVDLDDPRPFTEAARGGVYRVSGIIAEVLRYGWERVTRNPWGVEEFQVLTLISDHYRSVALRMILPYPIDVFEGVDGEREEHLRIYGVFIKNNTYDTQFARPDGSGKPLPITVPLFVVLHVEHFPEDEAGRGMRTLMLWVAGVMVLLGLVFYVVLIRGGQKQAERMEAHRWSLRRRVRASGGAAAQAPDKSDKPDATGEPTADD